MEKIVKAGALDLLSMVDLGVPGIAFGSELLSEMFRRRGEKARQIVIDEMRKGCRSKWEVIDPDEFVPIIYRYSRAALEGAATLNLRLMAKVMRGQALNSSMFASDFLGYADLISTLRREELVYLATMLKLTKEDLRLPKDGTSVEYYDVPQSVIIQLRKSLVGTDFFPDIESISACESAIQRTGLVRYVDSVIGGSPIIAPSPLLFRLGELADLEEALGDEGISIKQ